MKTLLALLLLILPTAVFGGTWIEERDKYDSSQTVILESNKDYVILENKSALIEAPEHSDDYLDRWKNTESENMDNEIMFVRKFGDDAAKECERQGNNTWFRSTDKRDDVHKDYFKVLSEHKGKFLCLPQKTMYTIILDDYLSHQSKICPAINNSDHEMFCGYLKVWIRDYTFKLKELGVDIIINNEKSLIAQKQKTCETLGFEMGTEKNGECVLKLMELDKQ